MPKIRKPTKADVSALLSDSVVKRTIRGQTVFSKPTIPKESKSAKKEATKSNFSEASNWAAAIFEEPGMKELYSKGITSNKKNARLVAITDYLTAPKIHYISLKQHTGAIGDKIRIKATDDFQVTAVKVTITNKKGKLLESGPAIRYKRKPAMWIYTLTVANPDVVGTTIKVIARDRPGNKVIGTATSSSLLCGATDLPLPAGRQKATKKYSTKDTTTLS